MSANTTNNYIGSSTGSVLLNANWSLGHVPTVSEDAVFTATTGIRTQTAGNLTVGSFNVTASTGTFSIRNPTATATNSILTLGGAGDLGNGVSGNAADLLYCATGSTFNIIGPNGSTGTGVLNVALGQSGNFQSAGTISVSSIISDGGSSFGITKTGVGTLTLLAANTYTGDTTISAGTLNLGTTGSLSSTNIIIGGGGTFDVSTRGGVTLASGQSLQGSGTATTGTIATAVSNGLTTASNSPLQFTAFNGTTAPLTLSGGGTLTIASSNPVTVNTTSALGAGDYTLIAKGATGTVGGSAPTSLTIGGSGLAAGMGGVLQITNSQMVLHVAAAGSLQFSSATYSDSETNADHAFNALVTRSGGSTGAVTVSYQVTDGSATVAGNDYTVSPATGTLSWADGDTSAKTITITVKGDTTFEPDETINLALSSPTGGATLGSSNSSVLTLTNDDPSDVTFNSSGSLAAGTYHDVTISNCGTVVTLTGDVTITGTLTINNCATLNTNGHTVSGSGTVAINGTVTVSSSDSTDGLATTITAPFTLNSGSTVDFNGSGAQTVGARDYYNLTISGNHGGGAVTFGSGTIGIITSFNPTASNVTYAFNANDTFEYKLPTTGTSTTVLPLAFTHYNNLKDNELGNTIGPTGLVVDGTLEVAQGTFSSASDYDNVLIDVGGTLTLTNDITVSGNWTNNGTFNNGAFKVTFDGSTPQTIGGSNVSAFANLTISNTGSTVTLAQNVTDTALNITSGTFDQGASFNVTSGAVNVSSGATWSNTGTGDLQLSGNVSNAGSISFNGSGLGCGQADAISISSNVGGTQRAWSGAGTFSMTDVTVQDQGGTATILVNSGTPVSGNGLNWLFINTCGAYTWNGSAGTDWTNPLNWTPARTTPSSSDILVFGSNTPGPTVTNVAGATNNINETIAELHINNSSPTFSTGGSNKLTINAGVGVTGLDINNAFPFRISGGNNLVIQLGTGTMGQIAGSGTTVTVGGGGHKFVSNDAGGITFQNGASFTTDTGFIDFPFGDGDPLQGLAGSVIFQSGSTYNQNAGNSPFGAVGNGPIVTFQAGSTARWFTNSGFQASGRTYANLEIGSASGAVSVSDGGVGNFQFDNLTMTGPNGGSSSTLVFSGSGTSTVTIQGDITSNGGTGSLQDVTLQPGSGGIVVSKPGSGTINFVDNSGNKRVVMFQGNASVASGTTLALSRIVQMGNPNPETRTLTVTGALTGSASGYVIGSLKKTFAAAGSLTFEVGSTNGYSPVTVNATTGTFPADFTAVARTPKHPSAFGSNALARYWTLTASNLTADLTFNYLAGDVAGFEALYKVFKYDGSFTQVPNQSVDTGTHTATVTGVSSFSDWTLADPSSVVCPSTFMVNGTGEASDENIGDGHCDWDSGTPGDQCSLRAAIEEANALGACGPITIDATSLNNAEIDLNNELPVINHNVIINGSGTLTVKKSTLLSDFRIFTINNGITAAISGVTISNGKVSSPGSDTGGGILNAGTLTLTNVTVSGNSAAGGSADQGGGIFNSGTLTISNSLVTNNSVAGTNSDRGGGIFNTGTLTLTNSTIDNNEAGGSGSDDGGGIYNTGTVTLTNTTVSNNKADGSGADQGGGIFNAGTLDAINSTLSNNSAAGANSDFGGGIFNSLAGILRLTNCTIAYNTAGGGGGNGGGGIYNLNSATARNTIIASNSGNTGPDFNGTLTSLGHNAIGNTSGTTVTPGTGDKFDANASPLNLGPLATNGGPTQTIDPGPGSVAIDAGDNCVTDAAHCSDANIPQLTTDQRGFNRQIDGDSISGAVVDIGAVEDSTCTTPPATPTPSNGGPYCQGATISLSTPFVTGATYAWTGPNGFTSALQNPTKSNATTADAGTYSVTITVNGCTSAAGTTNVVVNPTPATPTATNGGPYCEGATIALFTTTVAGATYSWTGPNGFTSALQNPTKSNATTADAGAYSVTITVNGCTSAAGTTNVVVNPTPATPTATNGGPYCEGATIQLNTPTVSGATYSWTGPNGFTSALQNPTKSNATTADAGTYSVTVTVNGCTSAAGTTNVIVNSIPATPTATNGGPYCDGATIQLNAPTVSGATYSWTGPNGFTSALQNPTRANATIADAGTYSVTVTVNGCTSAAGTTSVTVNPLPATPTASNGGPYGSGQTIQLSTPTVSGATYSWTGPNGFASALQNPTRANATTADAGTYSVTVTVNGCTSAAGTTNVLVCGSLNTIYVDDDWVGTTPGTDPDAGFGPATSFGCDSFATIQEAINTVTPGGTIIVNAGTYKENPTVNKAVNIQGPNAGVAGSAVRGAEATVITNGNQTAVFSITSNNVTIDGFTIDGDDPLVTGGTLKSGDDANVSYGVRPTGAQNHIIVKNDIVKHVAIGFRGDGASQNNLITANWFDSVGNFDFGYCVSLRTEYYADVTNNMMTRAWTGIHINDHHFAGGPASFNLSGNEIHSYAGGILYWLNYSAATGATINGNTITAQSGAVANNFGLLIVTLQDAVPTTITNNTITGHNYGVGVFNAPTSNSVTLGATNSISNSSLAGVFLTDNLNFNPVGGTNFLGGGPGAASTVKLIGLPVTGNVSNGLKVEGLTNLQTLAVSGGTSVSGGTVGLLMTGAKTAVGGNSLNDTSFTGQSTDYIQLANGASAGLEINATGVSFNGQTGATATVAQNYSIEDKIIHAIDDSTLGFVRVQAANLFVTPNSFVSPDTAASIQRAINAATSGDAISIQAGSYQGGVDASAKAIKLSPGASPAQVIVNGNLILTGDDTLVIEINGTNPATDYDNLVVSGTVTLGGATLSPPTGTHAPALGETFTLISNDLTDAVSGAFNGLPEGAIISSFLGSSFNARISYAADGDNDGNNNDVVLTVVNPPPAVGNYPGSPVSVELSGDTNVSPDAPPSDTTSIYVSTSTDFKGKLEGDPATGVVRVTDAHPAGNYTITVKAFGPSGSVTKTFTLTVTTPATCNPVNFGPEVKVSLPSSPSSVAVGDFNGDGKQDLAAANFQSDNVSITLGDGAGGFSDITAATDYPVASQPYSVAVGDFNGDGKQDLVTANFGTHNVSILLGIGDGTFSAPTNFFSGTGARAVAVGDFNGDGKPDLAVANASANNVSILIGNGAGSFSAPTTFGAGINPYSIAVGDFNGDGKQDLAVANYSVDDGFTSNGISILLGNGDGSFGTATNFGAGIGPRSVVVGDFNADNKQDLAVANERSQNISILLGNGDGSFGAANSFGSGDSPVSVAAGDFNGDGKQDVAMADYGLQKVSIWLGDGAGNLSNATNIFNGNNPASVAVGDFNADGMQDLAIGNARTYLSIYLRQCCPTITVSPATLPNGGVGSEYPNNITASGGTGPYTFAVTTGSAPTGLTLNAEGTWSGTASASGNFSFTVTATDSATGCTGTQGYTVTIVQGVSVAVSPASVAENGGTGMVYTFTRSDSTGAVTVNFAATGTADPNSDYSVSGATSFTPGSGTGTVAFNNGDLTKNVTVTPIADAAYEANETVIITISPSPSDYNPVSGSDAATGTIVNDDNPPANSQTFTVNNTSDDDDGACLPSPGRCSLRDAINAANANNDTNRIEFGIPADDPHHYYYADSCDGDADGLLYVSNVTPTTEANDQTLIDQVLIDPDWAHSWWSIAPAANLPAIIYPVTIDGYTQAGAEENTDPTCQDGVLRIELDGEFIDGATGLDLQAGASTVKGLVINRFVNYYEDVAGTGQGIKISQNGGNTITGNFIGTDISGMLSGDDGGEIFLGNQVGILIDTVGNNTIGGPVTDSTNATLRNLISANGEEGIEIVVTPVLTDRTRTAKAPGLKNLVSTGNKIQGNFIGTDAHGITVFDSSGGYNPMGNFTGISIYDGVNNVVGNSELAGPAVAGAGNVISGNFFIGVELASGLSGGPSGNGVGSNFIGTDLTATLPLGTLIGDGVQLCQDSHDNLVGGSTADYGNVIAYNGYNGVNVLKSAFSGNTIRLNSIHDNSYLGIDLNDDGFTDNDPGDADQGPNDLQNFPTITGATIVSGNLTIKGNLNSTPGQGQTYKIDFYANASCNDDQPDDTGHGEGQTYLGTVMADGDGTQFTTTPFAVPPGAGSIITATATDQFGSTSEFSQCFAAITPAIVQFAQANTNDTETNSGSHTVNIAVSRSNSTSGAVDVNYTVTDGTATTADNDYSIVPATGTLHWDDGDSTDKTITITVKGDTTVEADETVNLALSTPTGAQLGSQATSTLTIVNDDVACPTTFLVNSIADTDDQNPGDGHCDIDVAPGDQCTLRAAIREANALSSCGAITIDATGVSGTINLNSVLPDINHNVSINGPGANTLTVKRNAAGSFRIFTIDLNRTVSISGLTISNGSETVGGGIYNNHGTLTIDGCEISGNLATSEGGGVYNGGITVGTATLTITNSTISGNSSAVDGGGVYSDADSGPAILTMTNCTVSTNTANGNGGGVAVNSSTATLTNVTVTNNHADNDTNSAGNGGGLSATSSNVTLRNTIVAGNFRGGISSTTRDDVNGAITATSKKNLIGDGTGMTGISNGDANGNQVGSAGSPIDALLGKLIYNGGTTRTHGLLYNSPAIDAGDDTVGLSTDQRGLPRPADGDLTAGAHVDIGSYERQATETRPVPGGSNVNVDINDVQVNFPCTASGCLPPKANPDRTRTEATNIGPAVTTPTVSLTDVDPASMPAPPSGFVLGNSTSPALPAFNVSPAGVSYNSPVTLCFYLPSINDSTFFEGIRLFHQNGSSLDLLTNQTRNFANHTVCGQVTSFSNFAVGHTATPTATNAEISGQILDDHGNPVEGAAVRMSGAQDRLTITDAAGNYHFDNVETNGFYVVTPSRTNFSFSPTQRSFSQLGAKTEAVFTGSLTGTAVNPLDATEYFVRQHYLDFLGREPDESGFNFWVNNIESCGTDLACREVKRIDTSAAFFLSIEFQHTGFLVYRAYEAAYGDLDSAPVPMSLREFTPDTQKISNGLVVNQSGWQQKLETNKQAFMNDFVQRPRFTTAYPISMTPAEFVDKLFATAHVASTDPDYAASVALFGTATDTANAVTRALVLRRLAENSSLTRRQFNRAFVLMEYFGYLKRDPNAGRDTDFAGYSFWLDKLNSFNGNFENAEMVKAFLSSPEYRARFPR